MTGDSFNLARHAQLDAARGSVRGRHLSAHLWGGCFDYSEFDAYFVIGFCVSVGLVFGAGVLGLLWALFAAAAVFCVARCGVPFCGPALFCEAPGIRRDRFTVGAGTEG